MEDTQLTPSSAIRARSTRRRVDNAHNRAAALEENDVGRAQSGRSELTDPLPAAGLACDRAPREWLEVCSPLARRVRSG